MIKTGPIAVSRIISALSASVVKGKPEEIGEVTHIAEPLEAEQGGIAFIISESFLKQVASTKASVLVVQKSLLVKIQEVLPPEVKLCLACDDAYLGLAVFTGLVNEQNPSWDWRGVEGDVQIHPRAKIDPSAKISFGAVISEGAVIGPRTLVLPNVVIGPHVEVGADCVLYPSVVLYPRTKIGNRVRIHASAVLGSDGFGYARGPRGSTKIWHLGRVIVGDDVEIGAGTTIDRGTIKDTVIEASAKLDNLVQIGHNGYIKTHAILCAQAGLAGNVTIGRGAILAGKAGIADKVEIGDGAVVGPISGVSKDVPAGETVMGTHPSKPRREWWRQLALIDKLPELYERIKKLEGQVK